MNCLKTVSVAKEIGKTRMWFLSSLVMLAYFLIFFTGFQTFGDQIALVDAGFSALFACMISIVPAHLLLHCLPIWITGKKARCGYRRSQWPFFYYSVQQPISKNLSMISTSSPAVIVTLGAIALAVAFPAYTHYIAIVSAINFGLSTYDYFAFKQMMNAPNESLIEENRTGFHVIRAVPEQVEAQVK
jgi:hypothetical protein